MAWEDAGARWEDAPASPKDLKRERAERFVKARPTEINRKIDAALGGVERLIPFRNEISATLSTAVGLGEGDGFKERWKDNLETSRILEDVRQQARPASTVAGMVAGAPLLPAGKVKAGAGLLSRMFHGAKVGGGYGALYGASEGDSLAERAENAGTTGALGAGLGGAIPAAVEGVKWLARPVVRAVKGFANPEAEAAKRVQDTIKKAVAEGRGLTPEELAMAQQANSPLVLGDLAGEPGRALARSAANSSPEGREALQEVLQDRFAGQSGRISQFVNNLVGGKFDPAAFTTWLQGRARAKNAPLYAAADREAAAAAAGMPDGLWTPELQRIAQSPAVAEAMIASLPRGANRAVASGGAPSKAPFVKDADGNLTLAPPDASGKRALPNLQFWDSVKKEIDTRIIALARAGDNEGAATLRNLRSQMLKELDGIAPTYAKARASAASFFRAEDALEAGQNFVGMTKSADLVGARKALANMSSAERTLFAQGFAAELSAKINQTADNANVPVRAFFNSPLARQKIEAALGPKRALELETFLTVERTMDRLRQAVGQNSSTVRQAIESGLAGGMTGGVFAALFDAGVGGGVGATTFVVRFLSQIIDKRVAQRVGELLASNDPQKLQQAAQIISSNPAARQAFHKLDEVLIKAGGVTAGSVAQ